MLVRRLLLNILILSLSSSKAFAGECDPAVANDAYQQTKALACEIADIAHAINDGKHVVPKLIYHFGKEEHVKENVKAGTISKEIWDKFVMGEVTRFKLQPLRRGLYGTGGIATNSFGSKAHPSLMEIQIKDECRKPESVVSFFNLDKSEPFKKWFGKLKSEDLPLTIKSLSQFSTKCFYGPEFGYLSGKPKGSFTNGFSEIDCAAIVEKYLTENDIKILLDHEIQQSFYIRDRNCIETLRGGSPNDVFDMALRNDLLWLNRCGYSGGKPTFMSEVQKMVLAANLHLTKKFRNSLITQAPLVRTKSSGRPIRDAKPKANCPSSNHS